MEVLLDDAFVRVARARRVARRRAEVRLVIGRRFPRAVEVVALQVAEVERAEDIGHLDARVDLLRARRQERREQIVLVLRLAVLVQLLAELLEQLRVVLLVLRADDVARVPLGARPLPVDVDPVEDAGRGTRPAHAAPAGIGDVALDEEVDAGRDELLARLLRQRRVREVLREGPAADRDQHLQVRVLLLERLELLEVPEERPGPRHLFAVHRLRGGPRLLVVGPVVGELADDVAVAVGSDVAEGVVDHRQLVGGAARLHVLDGVVARVDAPLDEVADDLPARRLRAGRRARKAGCGERDCDHDRGQHGHGCDKTSLVLHGFPPAAAVRSGSDHSTDGAASHAARVRVNCWD